MKTATSIDGRFGPVARPPGAPGPVSYLTGVAARQDVHRQRRWADVVLVGENTLAADRPRLDGRLAGADQACPLAEPMPAYVDTDWSYAGDWPWQRFVVFGGKAAASEVAKKRIEESGGTVVSCDVRDGHVTPQAVLDAVFSDGGRVVMVEAGPTLAAAFLRSGLVDRWICYTAPSVLGGGPAWPEWSAQGPASDCGKFTLTRVERRGSDVKSVFDRLSFADVLRDLTDDRLDRLQPRRVLTDVHRARA